MRLRRSLLPAVLVFVLGSSVFFIGGCSLPLAPEGSLKAISNSSATAPTAPAVCNPVRIASGIDQTGSMGWTNTVRIAIDDFRPLLAVLLRCGGELSITFIRSESNRPMFRFLVPEPAAEPVLLPRGEDEEPFKFSDRKRLFEKDHLAWTDKATERNQLYGQKFDEFLTLIEPVLKTEPKGKTDFWGAVQRSKIMLSESNVAWSAVPHQYLVLVSDGVDTVGKPKVVLDHNIKVVWVDSKTDESILRELNAERFEAFPRALANIVAIEGGKEHGGPK